MTTQRDLKRVIRERQTKTGESYTAARAHVMADRAERLAPVETEPVRLDAAILKINQTSARVRIFGEEGQVTFRSGDVWNLAPGQVATLIVERRWTWHDDAYASGKVENPRIDIPKLGLLPLPLEGGEIDDVACWSEAYRRPDPYAPLWKKFTSKSRPSYEFDGIAWGALPGLDVDDNPTCLAADLRERGDHEGAREVLMETLGTDLRCIDAHAHLGNMVFDRSPEQAMVHYEIGIKIGELSLPAGFDGLLIWGRTYNRPFLRCLHGFGLCLWRLGRFTEAQNVFERILSLNPNDNQGVRLCWNDVHEGRKWDRDVNADASA